MTICIEFVLQLRAHLKRGEPPSCGLDERQYLDLAELWQQRCMEAETKCAELESQLITTERNVTLLEQQIHTDHALQRPASPSKRRATPATGSSRAKVPKSTTGEETTEHDMDVLEDNLGDGRATLQLTNVRLF